MSIPKIISTFPSLEIQIEDGTIFEFLDDTLYIYDKDDTPGCAEPLNVYILKDMYTVGE